jgi:hypothetical protein
LIHDVQIFAKKAANVNEPPVINAPLLFAAEELPELSTIIKRNFSAEGDIEKVSCTWKWTIDERCINMPLFHYSPDH